MVRWWRPVLIAIASTAVALPVRVQLDVGDQPQLHLTSGSAWAEAADGGGGNNGNGGGSDGGGKGNGGGSDGGGKGNGGNGGGGKGDGGSQGGGKGGGGGSAGQGNGGGHGNNGNGGGGGNNGNGNGGAGNDGGGKGGGGNAGGGKGGGEGGPGNNGNGNGGGSGGAGNDGGSKGGGGNAGGGTGGGGSGGHGGVGGPGNSGGDHGRGAGSGGGKDSNNGGGQGRSGDSGGNGGRGNGGLGNAGGHGGNSAGSKGGSSAAGNPGNGGGRGNSDKGGLGGSPGGLGGASGGGSKANGGPDGGLGAKGNSGSKGASGSPSGQSAGGTGQSKGPAGAQVATGGSTTGGKGTPGPSTANSNSARSSSQRGNGRTSVSNKDNPAAGQGKSITSSRGASKETKAASETRAQATSRAATGSTAARPGTTHPSKPVQTDGRKQDADPGEIIDPRPKPRQATKSILASGLSREDLAKLTSRGFRIESQTGGSIAPPVVRLRVPGGVSVAQARQTVRLVDARASADFDHFYYPDESTIPCTGADCTATSLIGWTMSDADQCGPAPLIGLIDTGINVEHDALKGQAIEVLARSAGHAAASLQDHGTAIAALLVGRPESQTPGLLPGAKIIAVDAFYRDSGAADRTDVMSLVAAMEKLANRNVRVMNLSLSGPPNAVLQKAIEAVQAKGIVIVAAAGNNGSGAEPSYPAAYPGVIAVTAVDQQFNVYRRATRGVYVDLAAPGVGVWTASAKGGGALRTGTSFAVPFASAAASLLIASDPDLDSKAVQSRLEESTRDLGEPGRDPTFGFGLIQTSGLCAHPGESPPLETADGQ